MLEREQRAQEEAPQGAQHIRTRAMAYLFANLVLTLTIQVGAEILLNLSLGGYVFFLLELKTSF